METIQDTKKKLEAAKKWFEQKTGMDSSSLSSMGISQIGLMLMHEKEMSERRER